MVRKMLDRSSYEDGSVSSFTSSLSSRSRFSVLSTRNSLIRSSMAPPCLRSLVLGGLKQRHGAVGRSRRLIRFFPAAFQLTQARTRYMQLIVQWVDSH